MAEKVKSPGEVIAGLRERAGLTRYALAKLSGVEQSTLSRLESGERQGLSVETARMICAALGCSMSVFDHPPSAE